jgi:D-glycero-alpha-D-manno-heptose 1-phosphate guanylyltransferase
MITEAIVLAGGLGTRLKSVVSELPKSLAPVAGKPFLAYLLDHARQQGIAKFIFALGYKNEQIKAFVEDYLTQGTYVFSVEEEPLGTGGAIYKACKKVSKEDTIVLNADTFFGVPLHQLVTLHKNNKAACTLALKPMKNFDRYGVVELNEQNRVTGFSEKKYHDAGLINGGVYALSVAAFLQKSFHPIFSFEKDYLENEFNREIITGLISDSYFIDIGIPEDFQRAQTELISSLALGEFQSAVKPNPTVANDSKHFPDTDV